MSGRLTALILAGASGAGGCVSLELPLPARAERAAVAIVVEEVPAEDGWRVYYTLGAPARGIELLGAGVPFRRERWGVAVAGGEPSWRIEGGRERLCFSRPARTVSVSFRTGSAPPPEDPAKDPTFSDGSRLLDTGHLLVRPIESCAGEAAPAAAVVLDPGLPAWLRAETAAVVPWLAGRLAAGRGGAPVPVRPLVLVAWGGDGDAGTSFSAGALRRGAPPSDLATLFGRLFEHAAATGGYGTRAFLGGLQELGAEPRSVSDLRWLIRGAGVVQGDRFLQRLLGHAGVAAELVEPAGATADPETFAEAVARAVGRCFCGTGEAASCDPAATGRQGSSLAGEPIAADPLTAWARLRAAVARGSALAVVLAGDEVTLFCTEAAFDPTWSSLLAPAQPER